MGPVTTYSHFTFWGTLAPAAGALDHVEHLEGLECLDYIRSTPSPDPHRIPISQSIAYASCCRGYSTRGTLHNTHNLRFPVASANARHNRRIRDRHVTSESLFESSSRIQTAFVENDVQHEFYKDHWTLRFVNYGRSQTKHPAFKNGGMLRST